MRGVQTAMRVLDDCSGFDTVGLLMEANSAAQFQYRDEAYHFVN